MCLFSHLFSCRAGSDGKEYQFLLKGHEDLRQDERVMQLFGLVNSLLRSNADTFRRNLTYVPCPLASGSSLLTVSSISISSFLLRGAGDNCRLSVFLDITRLRGVMLQSLCLCDWILSRQYL